MKLQLCFADFAYQRQVALKRTITQMVFVSRSMGSSFLCLYVPEFPHLLHPHLTWTVLNQHLFPAGLRTSSKEWPGAEEARQTPQHHLARPPLLCRTQPHFGHMVSRNWKSESEKCQHSCGTHEKPTVGLWFGYRWPASSRLSDLLPVCLLGEAADVPAPPAEAEDEGHPEPRSLQSAE